MVDHIRDLDRRIADWSDRNGLRLLRIAVAAIFLWFGALKFFPGASPAEALVARSVSWAVDPAWFLPLLALWECAIGIGLITNRFRKLTLLLLFAHMAGTFLPCVACPELVWTRFPLGWTLEGQYIVKNLVIVAGGLVLFGRVGAEQRRQAARRTGIYSAERSLRLTPVPQLPPVRRH